MLSSLLCLTRFILPHGDGVGVVDGVGVGVVDRVDVVVEVGVADGVVVVVAELGLTLLARVEVVGVLDLEK